MTPAQHKRYYLPAWLRVARSYGFEMRKGRLLCDLVRLYEDARRMPPEARDAMRRVLDGARAIAGTRAVTADDLRYACHCVAAGRQCSCWKLTNKEVNRVVALFDLLAAPESLKAIIGWQNPEDAEREGFVRFLRGKAPEAALRAIANNVFGTKTWEGLTLKQLRWLSGEVKGRGARVRGTGEGARERQRAAEGASRGAGDVVSVCGEEDPF